MGKIKILSDTGNVYEDGSIVKVEDLIRSFCECTTDKGISDFLCRIPIPDAVKFIADAWGIDYKFV